MERLNLANNIYEISNDKIIVKISEVAAEVHSFKKKDNDYNYVWSGDEKYWKGRNPILFPQVSSTDNKTTLINGTYYPMGNHGFARDSIFKLKEIKKNELTLEISENENTIKQYPFSFSLIVNYKLDENKMIITYTIKNNSKDNMPFGFGLHPAFNCLDNYENTKIIFNNLEDDFGNEIVITKELFEKYPTVIINNPKSDKATLISGDKSISINYQGFKIFAVWSKGPFMCLEPWLNHTDKDHTIEMRDRKDYLELKPNEEYKISYSWEIG